MDLGRPRRWNLVLMNKKTSFWNAIKSVSYIHVSWRKCPQNCGRFVYNLLGGISLFGRKQAFDKMSVIWSKLQCLKKRVNHFWLCFGQIWTDFDAVWPRAPETLALPSQEFARCGGQEAGLGEGSPRAESRGRAPMGVWRQMDSTETMNNTKHANTWLVLCKNSLLKSTQWKHD